MGMYTTFYANLTLRVGEFDALSAVFKLVNPEPGQLRWDPAYKWPVHEFFHTGRGHWALYAQCCGKLDFKTAFNIDTGVLRAAAEIKNYSSEYDKFMDWVSPFLDQAKPQLVWQKYEEAQTPTVYTLFPKPHNTEMVLQPMCLFKLPSLVSCVGASHRHGRTNSWGEYEAVDSEPGNMSFSHVEEVVFSAYQGI